MCMDARECANSGTPVQQWPCNSISNEIWVYAPISPTNKSAVYILSGVAFAYPKSKLCLDVPGGQNTPGLKLQITGCKGTAEQQWF
jgi:hypothetical protein